MSKKAGAGTTVLTKLEEEKKEGEKSKGYPPSDIRMNEGMKEWKKKGRKRKENNADMSKNADDEQIGNNKNLVEMKSLYIIKLPNHAAV